MNEANRTSQDVIADIQQLRGGLPILEQYHLRKLLERLINLPPTGNGYRIHTQLLGLANHGALAGLDADDCFILISEHVYGDREVSDREILNAIEKAYSDYDSEYETPETPSDRPRPARVYRKKQPEPVSDSHIQALLELRDMLITQGQGTTIQDIMKLSPVQLSRKTKQHFIEFLNALYQDQDFIFLGSRFGKNVFKVASVLESINFRKEVHEHIIPNPLCGKAVPSKSGKNSRRCDAAVSQFKYAIAEFDDISLEDQLAFWSQIDLPIVALIYSGSKSIHAWIRIDGVTCEEKWNTIVRQQLYKQFLIPMGVDPSCCNPARLSRTPGHHREGKKDQHCFYLAPEGKAVFA